MLMLKRRQSGFTIVELLIVIVVIGILAAIVIVAYNGVQSRGQQSKIQADERAIRQAIVAAESQTGLLMKDIVLDSYIGSTCTAKTPGTDLAALPTTDGCWTKYFAALDKLSTASGANIRNLVDPWGRPYWIDSNEHESSATDCRHDEIAVYTLPTNGSARTNLIALPFNSTNC